MKLAIVILNWNGKHLLQTFLPSVVNHSTGADVYVADNASTDDSIAFVKAEFPTVKLIHNSENLGFAAGYNEAIKSVDADLLCLLNNDVEVTENWLEPIIHCYNSNPDVAIIQPKILDYKSKYQFEYAGAGGGFIDKYGYPYCRGRIFHSLEDDKGQYDDNANIFWASGACFFIKKEIFQGLGGFDASLFAHMEEIDLCWRSYNRNYKVQYLGSSTVYHVGGATLADNNPRKTYLNFRNSLIMLAKNIPSKQFSSTLFKRLILDGIAGIHFLVQGKPKHMLSVIKAHFNFYGRLTGIKRDRKGKSFHSDYYKVKSIVWAYFIQKKREFNSL